MAIIADMSTLSTSPAPASRRFLARAAAVTAAAGCLAGAAIPAATAAPAPAATTATTATTDTIDTAKDAVSTKSVIQNPARVAGVALAAGVSPQTVDLLLEDPEATIAAGERLGVPRDAAIWAANNPEQAIGAAQAADIDPVWAADALVANL